MQSTQKHLAMFRHFLSTEMVNEIHQFSKIHQYDDRITFKDAWNIWTKEDDVNSMINDEIKRIRGLGYTEDIVRKMYISARYYHRKLPATKPDKIIHQEKEKCGGLSKEMLAVMDDHINGNHPIFVSPQESFNDFCLNCREYLEKEVYRLKTIATNRNQPLDPYLVNTKFKKAYKNRYYNARKHNPEY